ncbi:MAG: TrbI/VirB10 family protein, partial [Pseudomonadota bacterium]
MNERTAGQDQPIEADRDIPSVARRSGGQTFMIGAFLAVCAGAAVFVVWHGAEESAPSTLVDPDNEKFSTNRRSAGQPFITPERPEVLPALLAPEPAATEPEPEPEAEPTEPRPDFDPMELERLRAELERQRRLEEEALRLARENQERMAVRMRSPQLIVTSGGQAAPAVGAPAGGAPANPGALFPGADGGSGAPADANQAFLDDRAALGVQTSRAIQLENLDTLVPQGTLIGAILESAIQSDLPGQIRAIVSEDAYSLDQSRVLIPRGSRLIGSYRAGIVQGQTRVFVVWERLIRSDGVSIQVGSVGTDQLGRSGVEGFVDTHFFERFGASILLSLIDGALAAAVEAIDDDGAATVAVDGGNDFSRAAEI